MGDLELETINEAESGTYLASSTYDWNPLKTYDQPVFSVYKEDNRGYAVHIWAATAGLLCEGDNGIGGYFSGGTHGVYAKARDNYGVFGEASKEAQAGVFGLNKAPGSFGVTGQITGDKGIGVVGQTLGDKGIGVAGQVIAASGIGVQGYAKAGIGVHGFTESGAGVQGVATSGNGVEGFSSSPDKIGVYGSHDAKEGKSYGVLGEIKSNTGAGVYGGSEAHGTIGVQGSSGEGIGVYGSSNNQGIVGHGKTIAGVIGLTATGHGAVGIATAQTKCGVLGSNDGGIGVGGRSEVGVGVFGGSFHHNGVAGLSTAPLDITRIFDDPVFAGVAGVSTVGVGVLAQSMEGANAVGLYATAPQAAAIFKGMVVVDGNLVIKDPYNLIVQTPGAKNGVVSFADGSDRLLCAIESPEAWFEDFGEASLVKGKAHVVLDPSFMRTIEVNRFHVFITPYGETAGLYVSRRSKRGFDVTERKPGKSSVRFSWRLVARPRSATNKRFAKTSIVKSVNRLGSAKGRSNGRRSFDVTALNTTNLAVPLHKEPKLPNRAKPKLPEPPKFLKPPKLPELPKDRKPNAKARKPRGGRSTQ